MFYRIKQNFICILFYMTFLFRTWLIMAFHIFLLAFDFLPFFFCDASTQTHYVSYSPFLFLPLICSVNVKFTKLSLLIMCHRTFNCLFLILSVSVLLASIFFKLPHCSHVYSMVFSESPYLQQKLISVTSSLFFIHKLFRVYLLQVSSSSASKLSHIH